MAQPPAPDTREAISTSVTVSKSDGSEETIFQSNNFCKSDADITIISSDGVRFQLHKQNLALNTSGFPPLEFSRTCEEREEVNLSERGYILDLLFHFVYPHRYPDIEGVTIRVLSELADGAEKYEVYSAISVCNLAMKLRVPVHPIDVLAYATRYNYLDIADTVAPLVLGTPLGVLANRLPAAALAGWARYHASWDVVRFKWTASILDSMSTTTRIYANNRNQTVLLCSKPCSSRALLNELIKYMIPQTLLLGLAAAIVCAHCRATYVNKLIQDAPTQYSQFAKFRTFLRLTELEIEVV